MSTEDARPFVSLKQNAQNFKIAFDADIQNCSALLNEKITDLIRDPDSLGVSSHLKKGGDAHLEFSKAKFNIFLSMKSHFDEIEEKWSSMITEMKNDFLENVEIFLAETKLETKSSSSSAIASKRSRPSFSSSKQDVLQAVSSSIYPLISSITTKVPTLVKSPLREKSDTTSTEIDERIDEEEELPPVKKGGRTSKKGAANSLKEPSVLKPLPVNNKFFEPLLTDSDGKSDSDGSIEQEELPKPPLKKSGRPPKKGTAKTFNRSSDLNEMPAKVSTRNPQRIAKPAFKTKLSSTIHEHVTEDIPVEFDVLPIATKSRRKTMFVPQITDEDLSDQDPIPEKISRTKSKRKTMAGISEFTVAPSPKRLKSSGRKSISLLNEENETKDNLLDGGDSTALENYSPWIDLKSVNTNVPASSGIYELKVWRAKKPAFIGSCENLRHTLTLHKLGQNSGHKHLDKFLERNLKDVSVRYEIVSSIQEAKAEAKDRINNFVQMNKTTPAYN